MNSQVERSQRVRLKKNDENVGTTKNTKKMTAAGRQNQKGYGLFLRAVGAGAVTAGVTAPRAFTSVDMVVMTSP